MTEERSVRDVLVVTSSEWPVEELREAIGGEIGELRVVVPAVRQSRLQWLTNADDDVRESADDAAAEIADALPSHDAEASAGDPDPLLALEDALREFDADEVVFVSRPDDEASWLEEGSADAVIRAVGGRKVTRLTAGDR